MEKEIKKEIVELIVDNTGVSTEQAKAITKEINIILTKNGNNGKKI